MKTTILCLLIAASANGQVWQRHVHSGKGDSFDTPPTHPLAYFTRDPFLRDDWDDYCDDCAPAGKARVHAQHRFTTEVRRVGELHGFAIYDVFYRFDENVDKGEIGWKSILVQVGPGRFREIYHLQPTAALVGPSTLMKSGSEEILATRDLIPGTGNYSYEDYFWFSSAGAVRIDTGAINKAVQSLLPDASAIWKGGGLDMTALSYHSSVWKDGDGNCCPSGGEVDVTFRIDRGRVIVTNTHFTPPNEEAAERELQR